MYMHWMSVVVVLTASAILLVMMPASASTPYPVVDTTITVNETGAIHIKVVQTVPDDKDGAVNYHFDLQKMYRPENVEVYDYATGDPLHYVLKETSVTYGYDVSFSRPYYNGYTFVVEYDCHKRIIYEGAGVYSLGMRPAIDVRRIDRTYTVVLPVQNFTYIGYNSAVDHPTSETNTGDSYVIVFHNFSDAGASYAWEVRFEARGIDNEVFKAEVPSFNSPIPGMSFIAAITALVILAFAKKRQQR
jgi:hypothetical protein